MKEKAYDFITNFSITSTKWNSNGIKNASAIKTEAITAKKVLGYP